MFFHLWEVVQIFQRESIFCSKISSGRNQFWGIHFYRDRPYVTTQLRDWSYGRMCCILQEEDLYQEAEPIVASGITAALQLANKKGFIEEGKHWLCVEHVYSKQTHLLYMYASPYYSLYMFSVRSTCTVNKNTCCMCTPVHTTVCTCSVCGARVQ